MRKRELDRLRKEWQRRLALSDWRIRLVVGTDPKQPETEGDVEYDAEERVATIRITPGGEEPERVLIHELMHLIFELANSSQTGEEQQANAVSRAMIELKYPDGPR